MKTFTPVPAIAMAIAKVIVIFSLLSSLALAREGAPKWYRHISPAYPPPRSLGEAQRLHHHALGKVAKLTRVYHSSASSKGSAMSMHYNTVAPSHNTVAPSSFGADPTGVADSTAAFRKAIAVLLHHDAHAPLASNITDVSRALDLEAGVYLLSAPIVIPKLVGNVDIFNGHLVASPTFPRDRFLVEIGTPGCTIQGDQQQVCNENLGIESVFFDSSHVAAGGVRVSATMGTKISRSFFTGFLDAGVRIDGGHETLVDSCWFAEYFWNEKPAPGSNSTGISINGQDNYITNTIVFDYAKLGVLINGAANLLEGVHTWNGGGTGILIQGSYDIQDRLINVYLDYNELRVENADQILVEQSFFLDTGATLAGQAPRRTIFRDNVFAPGSSKIARTIAMAEGALPCARGSGVVIEDNILAGGGSEGLLNTATRATKSVTQTISESTVTCTLNFPEFFSGAGIDDVSYSVVAESTSGQELERKQEQGHRLGQYLTATTSARKNETSVEITIASAPAGSVWTVVATARQCV